MMFDKVTTFLLLDQDITLSNGKKIRIGRTKKEIMFETFKHAESIGTKIVEEIAENSILRQFVFLESKPDYSYYSEAGTSIVYPLVLDPNYNFERESIRQDYKDQMTKLKELKVKHNEGWLTMWQTSLTEMMESLTEEAPIMRVLKDQRSFTYEKLNEAIDKTTKENPKFFEAHTKNLQAFTKHAYEAQTLGRVEKYIEIAKQAQKNVKSINSEYVQLPTQKQLISTALNKLAKYVEFGIDSVCLDCWFEKNQLPFTCRVTNTKSIEIMDQCQQCRGKGLIHKIIISLPKELTSLILLDSSWLYEVVVGYAVAKLDFVKHVYVHKTIQVFNNGVVQQGVEADVAIITNDDKLYIIEVTKQSDTSNIMETINKKITNFEAKQIPYEKMMYFTSDEKERYYDLPKCTRVFSIKHIPAMTKFIQEFITG